MNKSSRAQLLWVAGCVVALLVLVQVNIPTVHISLMPQDKSLKTQTYAALIGSTVGAVVGAAATAGGIILTDKIRERRNRDHTRRVTHYNAIIKLQRQLDVVRATFEDNIPIIDTMIKANDRGVPTLQRPVKCTVDESYINDLFDLELINKLNQLYYDIRRFNFDIQNLTHVHDLLADEKFSGDLTQAQYKTEVDAIRSNIVHLRDGLQNELDTKIMDCIAFVRICADRDASEEMKSRLNRMHENRKPITDDEITITRKQIETELNSGQ